MFAQYVEQLKGLLHASSVGGTWFDNGLSSLIDLLTGPITGINTRFHWITVVEAIVVAALVFTFRPEHVRGEGVRAFIRYCFPRRFFTHNSTFVDCQLIVANQLLSKSYNVLWRLNTPLMVGALLAALTWAFGPPLKLFDWTTTTLVIFTFLMAMASDFGYFLFHYSAHRIPMLWAFHRVHHSAEILTPLTAGRLHPVEVVALAPARSVTTSLLLAPAIYVFTTEPTLITIFGLDLTVVVFGALGNQLLHSHIWLSWGPMLEHVIMSPAQHQVHHSTARQHWDKNMGGLFCLWDWMFGTLYVMRQREYFTFGLGEGAPQIHANAVTAYLRPFWDAIPLRRKLQNQVVPALGSWFRSFTGPRNPSRRHSPP